MKQFDKLQKSLRIIVAIVITVGALNLGYMSASQVSVSNDINLVDSNIQTLSTSTYSSGVYIDGKELDSVFIETVLGHSATSFWTSGVAPTGASSITAEKLADFKGTFTGTSKGIKDAYGIQYMTNATYVYLAGNEISDISYLAGVTVNWTRLWFGSSTTLGNNISDISALATLNAPSLTYLYLDSNPITDLTPLATMGGFTNLSYLYARYAGTITNLNAFADKTFDNLVGLYIFGQKINDISGLATASFPKMTNLQLGSGNGELYGNQITSVDALATMSAPLLANLYLDSNPITSIDGLANLDRFTSLTGLYIRYGLCTFNLDVFAGKTFSNMTNLRIEGNNVSNISGLATASFPKLTTLILGNGTTTGNNISDMSALATMSAPLLTSLYLDSNPISSLPDLSGLNSLTTLYARYGGEDATFDLSAFAGKTFSNMTALYLQGNNISNINGLATASFPKMTTLYLGSGDQKAYTYGVGNNISDISALSTMSAPLMTNLYLDSNPITTFADLSNLSSLINLYVRYGAGEFDLSSWAGKTFEKLVTIRIEEQKVSDISGLATASFPVLTTLYLGSANGTLNSGYYNLIEDITPITQMNAPLLADIRLEGNKISDISSLATASFPSLTSLFLGVTTKGNNVSDISALVTMDAPNLITLNLSSNPIADLSPLTSDKFNSLTSLFFNTSGLDSLDSIAGLNMTNLYQLSFRNNNLTDVAGLGLALDLSSLTILYLNGNGTITDLSGLNTLSSPLYQISIDNNQIYDLTPLMQFDSTLTSTTASIYIGEQNPSRTMQYISNNNGTITIDAPFILADGSFAAYSNLEELNATMSNGKITLPESVVTNGIILELEETRYVGLTSTTASASATNFDYGPLCGTVTIDFVSENERGGYVSQDDSFTPTNGDFSAPSDYFYEGDLVEITTNPATGWTLSNVTVTGDTTDANYSSSVERSGNSFSFSMPFESVSIDVAFVNVTTGGTITATTDGNGNVFTSSAIHYDSGESVTIQTYPSSGYALDTVTINSIPINNSQISGNSFTFDMPNGNAAISVTFKAVSFGGTISKGSTTNGSFTVPLGTIAEGTSVSIQTTPESNYYLASASVAGATNVVANKDTGVITFTMPNANVVVNATFEKFSGGNVSVGTIVDGEIVNEITGGSVSVASGFKVYL